MKIRISGSLLSFENNQVEVEVRGSVRCSVRCSVEWIEWNGRLMDKSKDKSTGRVEY